MTVREMHQSNRAAWNEAATHYAGDLEDRIRFLRALCWLHDMDGWASVVSRLLAPSGRLYVFDGHPLTWVWDQEARELRLDPVYGDYFQTTAQMEQGWGPTYIGELEKPKEELSRKYESQKTCGQIINPLIQAGLRLERLEEHAEDYWEQFPNLPQEVVGRLPNTFSLLMRKD